MNRFLSFTIIGACILFQAMIMNSCANIIPPGGGPRDSLPPRLISALPKDSAINVTQKNITLTFDEFVTLQGIQENLIVSPTLKNIPLIDFKLRNVTIKIKDSLDPNTTYSFNFGESVKDVNEGNTAKGITYVFSTGNKIDYNKYTGRVFLAETGKVDSTLIVVLHKNLEDTAIVKERPRYYTRIKGNGSFEFTNLPQGDFSVFVVPNDFSKKYDDSTKLFAFRSRPLHISSEPESDTLYAYQEFKRKEKTVATVPLKLPGTKDDKRLKYAVDFENGQQDILKSLQISFVKKLAGFDSSKFILYDTNFIKKSNYVVTIDTGRTKITIQYPWKEDSYFRLLIAKDAVSDSGANTLAKADTLRFSTKKESDYGSIRLRFNNLEITKNPVLQFVVNDKIVESTPLTSNVFIRKLYRPGTYDLRILFDANKNGIWDTGEFFVTKRQPEIVQMISKPINIKSNWDNEVTITL